MPTEVIVLLLVMAFTLPPTFLLGYDIGRARRSSIKVTDIDKYLHRQFPTEWTAYHRGVNEGYVQGRRDAEATDEPS